MEGKDTLIPTYCFVTHSQLKETELIEARPLILFEGILALYEPKIREIMDLRIFVHTDSDVCLARRLMRDSFDRGRTVPSILYQYNRFVKPCFQEYIYPLMKHCDIIVPFAK